MSDLKEKLNGFLRDKKLRKDQCLILVLSGILLFIIALPTNNKKDNSFSFFKSDKANTESDTILYHDTVSTEKGETTDAQNADTLSYTGYWENKLEENLAYVEGAGKVKVLITLKESEGKIVEKDLNHESAETIENDSAGGSRTVSENKTSQNTIYTVGSQGEDVPYVVRTTAPVVAGVVVITEGGDDLAVRQNIIDAIQVLFDIDVNNIRVVKMKKKN